MRNEKLDKQIEFWHDAYTLGRNERLRKETNMAKRTSKKANESRVSKIYGQVANGVQVPIFSLSEIMNAGLASVAAGGDDAAIGEAIMVVVNRVRVN